MLTVSKVLSVHGGKELVEIICLSTDTKPTEYLNGSLCLEMDTGDFYGYDADNEQWQKIGD